MNTFEELGFKKTITNWYKMDNDYVCNHCYQEILETIQEYEIMDESDEDLTELSMSEDGSLKFYQE